MRRFDLWMKRVFVAVLAATLLAVGCGEPTIDEEDAEDFVEDWAQTVETDLGEYAVQEAGSEAVEDQLQKAVDADEQKVRATEPLYGILVDEVYAGRDYEPALVGEDELTEAGKAVYGAVADVADHHLDPEDYRLEAIEEAIEDWEDRAGEVEQFDRLEATTEDREEAVEWLTDRPESEFELNDDNFDELTEALVEADEYGQRLEEAADEYRQRRSSITESAAVVERLLAVGLARYAGEQRHSHIKDIFVHPRHWDYYNEQDVEDSGPRPDSEKGPFRAGQVWREAANLADDISDENRVEILDERIQQTVREVLDSDDPEERVAAIPPDHPQYEGLVQEYKRYREIVEEGGWQEVQRNDHIRPGSTSETVAQLKERLRAEGYFPEDVEIDETWGEDLTAAIEEYQQTHQMHVDGRPDHVFWYSLNIPAERRLAQIGLNLDRWRETNVRHDEPVYAFVNIPDFTVELYHEQQRDMRFATVVGDNEKDVNPLTDEEEHSNRTPTPMAAYIDRVIFNPYWNVTDRIRAESILPDVKESIEAKYALKFDHYLQEARAGNEEVVGETVRLASITGAVGLPGEDNEDAFQQIAARIDAEDLDDEMLRERVRQAAENAESGPFGDDEAGDDGVEEGEETGELEDAGAEGTEQLVAAVDEPAVDDETAERVDDEAEEPQLTIEDLDEDQRQELKAGLVADKTESALQQWTTIREVRSEEHDRIEHERFFETSKLEQLDAALFDGDTEVRQAFRDQFPYVDWETGEVDVSETDPDHIPSWYAENNYEVVRPGHEDWEYVRMLPGEENSLGFVKIIFPNYDNIYLHDTPEKGLFNRQVRGFSHGCIRLEKPFALSERLLELGGVGEGVSIDRILESEEYKPIFLDRQIPIFIEYYTVRVDDEGRANFLADIYDYDEEQLGESS